MAAKHILVVDDAETIRDILQTFLLENGYSVDTAETCEDANKKIKVHKPDLILLDVVLPDMLGTDYCSIIKSNRETKFIPIIMCSANAISPQEKMKGLDTGADDYVTKPFILEELSSRIRALLRRVELDKTRHVMEEQEAQAAPVAASVETKVEVAPLKLTEYLAYSFTNPKQVYQNLKEVSNPLHLQWMFAFVGAVALFSSIPSILHGGIKNFFGSFFMTLIAYVLEIGVGALLAFLLFKFIFKKTLSFKCLTMVILVAMTPFILKAFLSLIFVFASGYEAEVSHFSAGLGLFLPNLEMKMFKSLSQMADLFSVASIVSAAVGLSILSELSFYKMLPAAALVLSLSLGLGGFIQ